MIITGKKRLEKFQQKHADARSQIIEWINEVEKSTWKTTKDIKSRYATASFVKNKVVFNIKGNKYRLIVVVIYIAGIVHIDWVGTHKEYNEIIL